MLLGRETQSARVRSLRVRVLLVLTLLASNFVGVAVATVLILFVLPGPSLMSTRFLWSFAVVVPVYVLLAMVVGLVWVHSAVYRQARWFLDGREPTERERVQTLRLPGRVTLIQGLLWILGAIVMTFISEYARAIFASYSGLNMLTYGILVIFIVLYLPGGIISVFNKEVRQLAKARRRARFGKKGGDV